MGSLLARAGSFIAIAGIISLVLSFTSYELRILMWIDTWGETMGYVIRGGLIVGGGILFLAGNMLNKD